MAFKKATIKPSEINNADEVDINKLEINDLKIFCNKVMNLPLYKDDTKEDLINRITKARTRKSIAAVVDESKVDPKRPPPGFAYITLMNDPTPGAKNRMFPVTVNTSKKWIPRGVMTKIPLPHLEVLQNAVELRPVDSSDKNAGQSSLSFQELPAHSFQVHGMTPGPYVDKKLEADMQTRRRKNLGLQKFRLTFGYWPPHEEYRKAVDSGELEKRWEQHAKENPEDKAFVDSL
jgi:hypothetical protein